MIQSYSPKKKGADMFCLISACLLLSLALAAVAAAYIYYLWLLPSAVSEGAPPEKPTTSGNCEGLQTKVNKPNSEERRSHNYVTKEKASAY